MAHNPFSPEVGAERSLLSNYGGPAKARNRLPRPESFKAQALRELASRLILEDEAQDLRARIMALTNRVETLEMEADIAKRFPA